MKNSYKNDILSGWKVWKQVFLDKKEGTWWGFELACDKVLIMIVEAGRWRKLIGRTGDVLMNESEGVGSGSNRGAAMRIQWWIGWAMPRLRVEKTEDADGAGQLWSDTKSGEFHRFPICCFSLV